ncbi:2-C-methyl-D-erythritol 2,4-cyclodiphosphate synthase [Chloroflexota bacterium]
MRVGFGFDSHRIVDGRPLVLCGVQLQSRRGLEGWSDADVAIHALIDALCGAAAIGDIGTLFPPGEAEHQGSSSIDMLGAVVEKLAAVGASVNNVDVTVVIEEPRLAPHVPAMRELLASTLRVPVAAVSVKAKTNECMGFVGRGEGAAAFAVATVRDA